MNIRRARHPIYGIVEMSDARQQRTAAARITEEPQRPQKGLAMDADRSKEVATLAGGCFWCLEAVFDDVKGVDQVDSGYSGGTVPDPTYRQVCTGTTGHAEVVQVTFDPQVISFKELLQLFFTVHDPTTLNRQGPDVGTQYRSAIFYHTPAQKAIAEQVIKEMTAAQVWPSPIITEVTPFSAFYKAEDYHQEYFKFNGEQPYCRAIVAPKVAKFRKQFRERLKGAQNVSLG
jgi:peptide-methionine (S)-S-oxide reductase